MHCFSAASGEVEFLTREKRLFFCIVNAGNCEIFNLNIVTGALSSAAGDVIEIEEGFQQNVENIDHWVVSALLRLLNRQADNTT